MSERPWYRRYPSDFLHGTAGMSLEVKGAYSVVLDLIFDRRGPIPDDARWIAGHCGCSVRLWNRIRSELIEAGKLIAQDGKLGNERALREVANDELSARKLAENGAKGGNKSAETRRNRAENRSEPNENNDIAEAGLVAGLKHRARVPEPYTRNNPIVPLPKPDIEGSFREFKQAYPKRDGSQEWARAKTRFAALVGKGIPPDRLIASAQAYCAEAVRKGNLGTSYVKQAATFLSGAWEEYGAPDAESGNDPHLAAWPRNLPAPSLVKSTWQAGKWPRDAWGAEPGEQGSRVPAEIAAEWMAERASAAGVALTSGLRLVGAAEFPVKATSALTTSAHKIPRAVC